MNRRTVIVVLCLVLSGAAESKANTNKILLCRYEKIFVPCIALSRPKMLGNPLTPTPMRYCPVMAIPVWPNNDIFGGYEKVMDDRRFDHKYYNRIAKGGAVLREHDIRQMEIADYAFGPNYAFSRFAALKDHDAAKYLTLLRTSEVFRGDEVFALWMTAVSKGVICGKASQPLKTDEPVAECGFSRIAGRESPQTTIEYCGFGRFAESGASDDPLCIEVAKKDTKGTSVLASPYIYYGQLEETGGGEAGVSCGFVDKTTDELKERFDQFLRQYLGESRKYDTRAQSDKSYSFRGEGLRIRDDLENVFKRVYVTGRYLNGRDGSSRPSPGAKLWLHFAVTISAQASDNIIDYREPNEAMGNRLHNRLVKEISEVSRDFSPRSTCEEED